MLPESITISTATEAFWRSARAHDRTKLPPLEHMWTWRKLIDVVVHAQRLHYLAVSCVLLLIRFLLLTDVLASSIMRRGQLVIVTRTAKRQPWPQIQLQRSDTLVLRRDLVSDYNLMVRIAIISASHYVLGFNMLNRISSVRWRRNHNANMIAMGSIIGSSRWKKCLANGAISLHRRVRGRDRWEIC